MAHSGNGDVCAGGKRQNSAAQAFWKLADPERSGVLTQRWQGEKEATVSDKQLALQINLEPVTKAFSKQSKFNIQQ